MAAAWPPAVRAAMRTAPNGPIPADAQSLWPFGEFQVLECVSNRMGVVKTARAHSASSKMIYEAAYGLNTVPSWTMEPKSDLNGALGGRSTK